jgi:hypothetical protein
VKLQRQDAGCLGLIGLAIDHFDGRKTVDRLCQVISFGGDFVFVPFPRFDAGQELGFIASRSDDLVLPAGVDFDSGGPIGQDPAAAFVVQDPRVLVSSVDIGLVTADVEFAEVLAPVLDSRVAPLDPKPKAQFKIIDRTTLPDQERIRLERSFRRRPPRNRAVLNRPIPFVPLPAGERLAVEQSCVVDNLLFQYKGIQGVSPTVIGQKWLPRNRYRINRGDQEQNAQKGVSRGLSAATKPQPGGNFQDEATSEHGGFLRKLMGVARCPLSRSSRAIATRPAA